MKQDKNFLHLFWKSFEQVLISAIMLIIVFGVSNAAWAEENTIGKDLFIKNCSGCHINGGNIIRRNKTLKIEALKRNGLDNPEAIARIARIGIGSMSGYEEVLGEGGDQLVANWIWEQTQNAWTQG